MPEGVKETLPDFLHVLIWDVVGLRREPGVEGFESFVSAGFVARS